MNTNHRYYSPFYRTKYSFDKTINKDKTKFTAIKKITAIIVKICTDRDWIFAYFPDAYFTKAKSMKILNNKTNKFVFDYYPHPDHVFSSTDEDINALWDLTNYLYDISGRTSFMVCGPGDDI